MLTLRPMTDAQYAAFLARSVDHYSHEVARSREIPIEEARALAEKSFSDLLPKGLATPEHHLFSLVVEGPDSGAVAGELWFGFVAAKRRAFLYEIWLAPEFRDRGLGRAAMLLLEQECRRRGAESIGLHVFGHNARAHALYQKLGYAPTSIQMLKRL